ncbi:MAG: hypothetical protein HRF45_04795 [Fimbriimonadia bacterium]
MSLLAAGLVGPTVVASQDIGPNPWQIEIGAFFPQEEIEELVGETAFLATLSRDVNRSAGGAVTSVGISYTQRSDAGSEIAVAGAFLRQTWFGKKASGGYGGPFGGFEVGLFDTRVQAAEEGDGGGGNGEAPGRAITPGTKEDQIGVGASIFAGYMFGDRLSLRGGYSAYPAAGGASVTGFFATLGFRF